MFCTECGARVSDTANFCNSCGAKITVRPRRAAAPVSETVPAPAPAPVPAAVPEPAAEIPPELKYLDELEKASADKSQIDHESVYAEMGIAGETEGAFAQEQAPAADPDHLKEYFELPPEAPNTAKRNARLLKQAAEGTLPEGEVPPELKYLNELAKASADKSQIDHESVYAEMGTAGETEGAFAQEQAPAADPDHLKEYFELPPEEPNTAKRNARLLKQAAEGQISADELPPELRYQLELEKASADKSQIDHESVYAAMGSAKETEGAFAQEQAPAATHDPMAEYFGIPAPEEAYAHGPVPAAKAAPVRIASKYIEVAPGIELHYLDAGKGAPMIFIPGLTFSGEIFLHQIEHFSKTNRVIAIDPRGQGLSSKTVDGNDYLTHGKDLAALIDKLGLTDIVLVGWSTGNLDAWSYAKQFGTEKLRAVVTIDMSPLPLSADPKWWTEGTMEELSQVATECLTSAEGSRAFFRDYATGIMIQHEMTPEELEYLLDLSARTPYWICRQLFCDAIFSNYLATAKKLGESFPTVMFIAEHWADVAKPFVETQMPGTRTYVMGGHLMFFEHPMRFNAALENFLADI